jgi:hypothetical protein
VKQQVVREMRADEAGATRDQNAFHQEFFRVVHVARRDGRQRSCRPRATAERAATGAGRYIER